MTIIHDPLVSRRDFLRLGITVSSGIVLPPLLSACGGGGGDSPVRPEQTFVQPTVLQSVGGLLDVTLTVRYLDTTLPGADPAAAGQKVSLRAYGIGDGRPTITGPTLSVNAGDRLRIRLVNRLPANPVPNPSNPHFLGTPNNTNMHTHGLHVIPGIIDPRLPLYGDYVMDPEGGGVAPGQERQYQYDLRPDHPCGPFWYHPHFHGSSAMQLASFMAGALMIRGPVDALPAMAAASELVFVFQAPLYASAASKAWPGVADGTLESFSQVADSPTGAVSTGGAGIPPVLINGVRRPRIVMGSGEVQRWRFINAQIFNSVNLSLDGHVLHRYTSDGYGSTTYVDFADGRGSGSGLALAPSNRASVTVQAGAPGVYYLRTLPITVAGPGNRGTLPEDILAEVVVVESAGAMSLPQPPFPRTPFLDPVTDAEIAASGGLKRNIVFRAISNALLVGAPNTSPITDAPASGLLSPGSDAGEWVYNTDATSMMNTAFTVGAVGTTANPNPPTPTATTAPDQYWPFQSPSAPTQIVRLGSAEEWTVYNMNRVAHPFHIHVNPIWVTKVNGVPIEPYWADTVALPIGGSPTAPTSITFRTRFLHYTGPYVMHCHMLAHEDMGMMQGVTVV